MRPIPGIAGCAAIACTFCCGMASAQDVQIYGIVDVYAGTLRDSGSTKYRLEEGGHMPSRFGLRGTESLGGGVLAHFVMEMGLTLDTGAVPLGGGFGRQSLVGLSAPQGMVEMGRGYTPVFFNLLATSTFGMNVLWAPVQLAISTDGLPAQSRTVGFPLRQSNLLRARYGGPIGDPGLRMEATVSAGEGGASVGRSDTFAISYRGPKYFVSYGVQRSNSGTAAASAFRNELQAVSGRWRAGNWTVNANYIVTDSGQIGGHRATNMVLGTAYSTGPHTMLIEGVKRELKDVDRDALMLTLGYDRNLSKRTTLYVRLLTLDNRGTAANTMAGGVVSTSSGDDVRASAIGIRHTF